jgi:hypothetical protein
LSGVLNTDAAKVEEEKTIANATTKRPEFEFIDAL